MSYSLWRSLKPAMGHENWHCQTKRGFEKARNKEPEVQRLISQDNQPQKIGKLAQRGVFEFHQEPARLSGPDGVEQVAEILQLNQESPEIQARVLVILNNYYQQPILLNQEIINLSRGDEGYPEPIVIEQGNYRFNLSAAFDCIFREADDTIHILDLKTGQSNFDRRQAHVYLLAASYLYPQEKIVASFYNLETQTSSENISLSSEAMEAVKIELAFLSKKHQQQLKKYKDHPEDFYHIFPPQSGYACSYCPFTSICDYANKEV
ncbi:PD-(D/E)XK nuclease family protein [Microcystis aeruginosa]|uniref:PD-(D/E)XK nuclease family protein n=1 Tax=Microcystis aeruginosa TaxID=1126 RepID=UPI002FEDFB4A